jgi:hypothetical protein
MSRQYSMVAQDTPVVLLPPAADAAGRTSSYRSLKNADKAYVVVHINQGNAATVALTLLQAKDVSGTSSKALGATPIWLNDATASSDAFVAQAAAAGFTTDANVADKIVVFEIEPEACMDVANGFRSIAVQTGASNAANITEAKVHIHNNYAQATPPSSYTN